jgi:hypothetical protein
MRSLLSDILGQAGLEVVGEAQTGTEAVAKFKQLKPDLVTGARGPSGPQLADTLAGRGVDKSSGPYSSSDPSSLPLLGLMKCSCRQAVQVTDSYVSSPFPASSASQAVT